MIRVEYSFTDIGNGHHRPYLPISVLNPKTGQICITRALLDTGADDCLIPRMVAQRAGCPIDTSLESDGFATGISGNSIPIWKFDLIIQLLDRSRKQIVKTSKLIKVDCAAINNAVPLLGTKTFLHDIKVTLDYPKKTIVLEWDS